MNITITMLTAKVNHLAGVIQAAQYPQPTTDAASGAGEDTNNPLNASNNTTFWSQLVQYEAARLSALLLAGKTGTVDTAALPAGQNKELLEAITPLTGLDEEATPVWMAPDADNIESMKKAFQGLRALNGAVQALAASADEKDEEAGEVVIPDAALGKVTNPAEAALEGDLTLDEARAALSLPAAGARTFLGQLLTLRTAPRGSAASVVGPFMAVGVLFLLPLMLTLLFAPNMFGKAVAGEEHTLAADANKLFRGADITFGVVAPLFVALLASAISQPCRPVTEDTPAALRCGATM